MMREAEKSPLIQGTLTSHEWDRPFSSLKVDSLMCFELIVLVEELAEDVHSSFAVGGVDTFEFTCMSDLYRYYLHLTSASTGKVGGSSQPV
jgi:hypothetical protein